VKKGPDAFASYLTEDARLLRADIEPAVGKNAAMNVVSARQGTLSWVPVTSDIASSGDLGYTYGTFDLKSGGALVEHGSYVRVWKKQDGKWKVVMDVMSPDPKG
jgi:ketosteroid isomerase-like protein